MSKALRTIATVVEVAVAIAAAIPSGGTSLLGAALGVSATAATAIAAGVGLAASVGEAALAKKPTVSVSGDQTKFTASITQGIPYVIGRTQVSGWLVHRNTWNQNGTTTNPFQALYGVWGGGGPYHAIESFKIDGNVIGFTGPIDQLEAPVATGSYNDGQNNGWMWLQARLGQCPAPAALHATGFHQYVDGWTAASKMSGYAGFVWTVKWDDKGKVYPSGLPQPAAVLQAALVYDPRQDSTYPGGSGSCRALDETTYVYSQNPGLHALTWALGRWQNGKRVLGIGMALATIDVPAYVQAANIADANGWTIGGTVYSTDGKWDVLKKMLAACSGQPLQLGGVLSCEVDTPRVSLATITDDDILDVAQTSVVSTPTSSQRFNGCIPSCRLEAHDWQIVPCAQVTVSDYVTFDGKPHTTAITWELVQDAHQVGQLATYAICNAREFGPIVAPLKLRWIGYKPGDALTINSANLGQQGQLVVVQKRHLDPSSGAVTMTMRSETTSKHAFALGQTTTPPPTPSLQVVDQSTLLIPGVTADWGAVSGEGKPSDNATNSADPSSPFADSTVGQIKAAIDAAEAQLDQLPADIGDTLTRIEAEARQGAPNLLLDGSFAQWPGPWQGAIGRYSVLQGTDQGTVLHHVFEGSTAGDEVVWQDAPVNAGEGYSFSFEGNTFGSYGSGRLVGQWLDTSKNPVGPNGGFLGNDVSPVGIFAGRQNSSVVVAPTGAAFMRLFIVSPNSGTGFDLTRVMVQAGAPTAWRDDASQASNTQRTTALEGDQAAYIEQVGDLAALLQLPSSSTIHEVIAKVTQMGQAGVDATGAASTFAQQVSAEFGQKADAGITAGAISDLKNRTQAYVNIEADAGNSTARIGLTAQDCNGNPYASILLDAPNVLVDGNLLVNGSVQTAILAPNSITATATARVDDYIAAGSGVELSAVQLNCIGGTVLIFASMNLQNSGSNPFQANMQVKRDGTSIFLTTYNSSQTAYSSGSGTGYLNNLSGVFTVCLVDYPGAGTHRYSITADNAGADHRNIAVMEIKR